ncbi:MULTISPECIES: TraB/VirB10 family protein [unclassified Variovorax]|uniref:TraB/VirB10 family protein n=1 Tax=unclassified Variovorax TaxID=663243 RepID=UPI00076D5383|nr:MULTISPECIES: TraB/VirB10 family protein [unclassified Variovorax]KWT98325.1 IncF plasmid conjugative transfer pilus assembly protein TraB [Variovorax sp. WDL1]PNG50020.1 hypothetical protein CHC06_05601 [Variovorax sp. B2]PNG50892.1 hypothetical protein CHC07_05506 [Variovorax sp. B4]VTU41492.1 conjugal transfer pilus assembly protein TraB [Variovorax sp. SRS16]VTU41523.1 conjugal transfer pilus assembly protein TraB [Variovorax sp. PBL-E5]
MSDDKKPGLFINNKSKAAPASASAIKVGGKQKNVQRRWLYVAVGLAGVAVISTAAFSDKKSNLPDGPKKEAAMINVTPPNADKVAFEAKFGKDLEGFKQMLEQLKSDNLSLKERVAQQDLAARNAAANGGTGARSNTPLPAGVVPPPSQGNSGGIGSLAAPEAPPPPPAAPARPAGGIPIPAGPGASGASLPPITPTMQSAPVAPMVFEVKDTSAAVAPAGGPSVNSKISYKKNESAGLLPAGGFAPVVLLNGLDAGTSVTTQSNPMPVLMNVTEQATLPGAAKYRLKNCFVLGNGYGDLSAERVYVRFNRLSCVDKGDRLILSQEVAGYVVDSDGKLGLRGKVMDRQGARLGKALLAGFAQGLSGALGQAQGTVTSNLSTGSTMSSLGGAAALRASGLSGAQTAAQQIAEFYLKEAQAIFPVVSIDTGRTGTIVFTNSVSLNWGTGESQFVQEVKPNN